MGAVIGLALGRLMAELMGRYVGSRCAASSDKRRMAPRRIQASCRASDSTRIQNRVSIQCEKQGCHKSVCKVTRYRWNCGERIDCTDHKPSLGRSLVYPARLSG
jgi:hypothetical protein